MRACRTRETVIDVAFTPAAIRPATAAIVIDVLRASSTITQALAAGYRRILCCRTIEEAEALRAPGRVLAGERNCVAPPGFDLGNSPGEFTDRRGEEVVLTTTNGCPALVAAAESSGEVLIGCLLSLHALLARLDRNPDLLLVCAGTNGKPAFEDIYLAGRIVAALAGERTDAARVAEAVALAHPDPAVALASSLNAHLLRSVGLEHDVRWCARESVLDVVPRVTGVRDGVVEIVAQPSATAPPPTAARPNDRPGR